MRKDHITAALKAAFLTFLVVFFLLLLICSYYFLPVLIPLFIGLLTALPTGLLTWYHKRIDQLEREVNWLTQRLYKQENRE